MPCHHLVFLRLKETGNEFVARAHRATATLLAIPGCVDASFGRELGHTTRAQEFTHLFRVVFESRAAFEAHWADHPLHQAFGAEFVGPYKDGDNAVRKVDIDDESAGSPRPVWHHVVFFEMKDTFTEAKGRGTSAALPHTLAMIPGVLGCHFGKAFITGGDKAWNYALTVTFSSRHALEGCVHT